MRDTTPTIDNAIGATSLAFLFRATIEPSYIHFDSVDTSDVVSEIIGSDFNNPNPEELSFSPTSGSGVTWYKTLGSASLRYCLQGDSSPVTTTQPISGKPGVYGSYIFYGEVGHDVRRDGINWSGVASKSTSPFSGSDNLGTSGGDILAVHAVSDTSCVVLYDDDGGIRPSIFVYGVGSYEAPGRFMGPTAVDYTPYTSGSSRTMQSIGIFSGAAQLGENICIYLSNPLDGSVDGIMFNTDTHVWSDIFVCVPTNLQSSLCEFRVCNAYVSGSKIYLVGQFHRTEVVGTNNIYTMILSSTDGISYSMDNFTYVSSLGYRFLAKVASGMLHVGSANRIGSSALTYAFAGTSGSGLSMNIPMVDFVSFRETGGQQAELVLRSGDDYYAYHPYMHEGSRISLELGYATTSGSEFIPYSTYIINGVNVDTAQGARQLNISLVNYSEWLLSGLNSPYYTEFFAKSSVYDDLESDSGNLYPAVDVYEMRHSLIIDFWSAEEWEETSLGVEGFNVMQKGGVSHFDVTAAHTYGVKCRDIITALNIQEEPKITGDMTFKVYGWSHPNGGGDNDNINLVVFYRSATSGSEHYYVADSKQWDISYPSYAARDGSPFTVVVPTGSGIAVDDTLTGLGIIIDGTNTDFCPARIELLSGIDAKFAFTDANTPWEQVADGRNMPGNRRPYIMFSQKPYDAWNFFQVAEFRMTTKDEDIPSASVCGVGFVGLAKSGSSHIIGRYDQTKHEFQIVKVRDCVETELASVGVTIGETFTMGFSHHDGRFALWLEESGVLVEKLSYEWSTVDGWMYESDTISKKCGVWGGKLVPWFEIVGLDYGGNESGNNSDAIAILPGFDLTDWPSTGEAKIESNIYSYTSKVTVAEVFGPHQFRNSGIYEPPYGVDKISGTEVRGLEYIYHDWQRGGGADPCFDDAGKLAASDNGGCYTIAGSFYRCWITTGGEVVLLHGRSRHYSYNDMIAKNTKWCSNRIYTTGGLVFGEEGGLISGKYKRHGFGTICSYNIPGDLTLQWYRASSGKEELNVKDLIRQISQFAGASATFPGDVTEDSRTPGAEVVYPVGFVYDAQGIDIEFEINDLGTNSWVDITTDAIVALTSGSSYQATVKITKTASDTYRADYIAKTNTGEGDQLLDSIRFSLLSANKLPIRVIYHDNFTTLDIGRSWVFTFSTGAISYPSTCGIYLLALDNIEFRDVVLTELSDWREAIYIDLETDGKSAIGSVIQERPIETRHCVDGSIAYWYEITRERIAIFPPRRHTHTTQYPRSGSSDALIQGNYTQAIQVPEFLSRYGFATKVMRMPNLTIGAVRAAKLTIKRLIEQASAHTVYMRPDIRIEVGDVIEIDFIASGTNQHIDADAVVESTNLSFSASDNNPTLTVSGREEL